MTFQAMKVKARAVNRPYRAIHYALRCNTLNRSRLKAALTHMTFQAMKVKAREANRPYRAVYCALHVSRGMDSRGHLRKWHFREFRRAEASRGSHAPAWALGEATPQARHPQQAACEAAQVPEQDQHGAQPAPN